MTKHESKDERQQQILMAAMQCFATNSYANTTMDEIAEAVKLSKGSLYRYYKSKKDLFLAILQSYFDAMTEEVDHILQNADSQESKLKLALQEMNQIAIDPDLQALNSITLDFYSLTRFDEDVSEKLNAMLQLAIGIFEGIIQVGVDSGEFNAVNARHYALILMGIGDGLGLYQMLGIENYSYIETMSTMEELIWLGLRKTS